eukprot:545844-Rhodomonas_salina.2
MCTAQHPAPETQLPEPVCTRKSATMLPADVSLGCCGRQPGTTISEPRPEAKLNHVHQPKLSGSTPLV